jgi:hypothetical protein
VLPYADLSHLGLGVSVDVDALQARHRAMSDADLIIFGRQMRASVYPLRYGWDGLPVVRAFKGRYTANRRYYFRGITLAERADQAFPISRTTAG